MGILNLIDRNKVSPGLVPAQAQSTDFFDNVDASFQSTMDNYRVNSKQSLIEEGRTERDKRYKELTGRDIYEDAKPFLEENTDLLPANWAFERATDPKVVQAVDKVLEQYNGGTTGDRQLLNSQGLIKKAEDRAKDSLAKQQEVAAGATRTTAITGGLVGGLGAMAFDPLNVASLPFGAGASRSLLKTIFIEAGINAGVEVASQPFVADWQNQIGQKYGFNEMAENVGMAALFGAAVPVGLRGLELGARGGVEVFDGIKQTLKKYGKLEAADSAEYMARKAHIDGSRTPDVELHQRAMDEANSAVLEGRALNPEKTDTPIPKHTGDPSMRTTVERFNDVDTIADEVRERMVSRGQIVESEGSINPLFREEKPRSPDVEVQEKIEELYSSPDAIRAEQESFDDIESLPDERPIEFDADGEPTKTVGDYKREIQADMDYLNAIRTCSL